MALQFRLHRTALKAEASVAGFTVYEGGELYEGNRCVGVFAIINDTITGVTDFQNLDTAVVSMTLFFFSGQGGVGHTRGQDPENMVLEGANEFQGQPSQNQPRETTWAMGSVSAASHQFAQHIAKQWRRDGDQLTVG